MKLRVGTVNRDVEKCNYHVRHDVLKTQKTFILTLSIGVTAINLFFKSHLT